ncbi:MAG: asparagine synthetase A [Candidatus Heimdallarchaeota archaeon]
MNILTEKSSTTLKGTVWRKTCFLSEFSEKAASAACLMGWLHDRALVPDPTFGGIVLRITLRDCSGLRDFVVTTKPFIDLLSTLEYESVIAIKVLGKEILDVKILARAKPAIFSPKVITDFSTIDLVVHRPLAIRTERMKAVLRVQDQIFTSARQFFHKEGFCELRPPILSPATDPGIRGAIGADVNFYGKKYKITTSMILYKQMAICSLEKVYAFSPNVRLEPVKTRQTGRHLAEFCQIDVEQAFINYHDAMALAERLLVAILSDVKNNCQKELKLLERSLTIPTRPFKKLTFQEALNILSKAGFKQLQQRKELPWEAEKMLSNTFDEPFWVTEFPYGSRGFYDRQDPNRPAVLRDFDLLYPAGFGEAISGSEREYLYPRVKKRMLEQGLPLDEYSWYLDMLQHGVPPSAGFGLGLERLTRYICGLENIWEATAFPKVPGVHSP